MRDDIIRQMSVDCAKEPGSGNVRRAEEVDDLGDGMNAGVGSSAGVRANPRLAGQAHQGSFQRFLHGPKSRLRLPTAEVGAIVAQDQLEVAHARSSGRPAVSLPIYSKFSHAWNH